MFNKPNAYKIRFRQNLPVIALIGLVFTLSFFSFACSTKTPSSPDEIIFPTGYIRAENHADYGSYLMFIEHPDFNFIAGHPNPKFPQEVNDYLEKMHEIAPLFDQHSLSKKGRILPVVSDGQEMILVVCSEDFDERLTLLDSSLNVLDARCIYGPYIDYFASAIFRDRLWILGADGGNQGYMVMNEIKISQGQLHVRKISSGDRYFQDTYKIINPSTNPEMVIHQRKNFFGYNRMFLFMLLPFILGLLIMVPCIFFLWRSNNKEEK